MKTIIALAIAASCLTAAPASAQIGTGAIAVPYGDLNLRSASGTETLERRIKAAAYRLCGTEQAPGLAEWKSVQDCRAGLFEAARPQLGTALAGNGTGSIGVLAASR